MPPKRNAVSPKGNDPKRPAYNLRASMAKATATAAAAAAGPSNPRPSSPTNSEMAYFDETSSHISDFFSELAMAIFDYLPEDASTLIPKFHTPAAKLVQAMDAVRVKLNMVSVQMPSSVELWTSCGGVIPSTNTTSTNSVLPIPVYGPLLPPDWKGSKFIRRQPVQHTGTQCDAATTIIPSRLSYADALIQTTTPMAPQRAANKQHRAKSVRTREQNSTSSKPTPSAIHPPSTLTSNANSNTNTNTGIFRNRAYVIHGIHTNRRLCDVREELELRESKRLGRVEGIRWLLPNKRRRKGASSIVIYLESPKERPVFLWVGYKRRRVDVYDFDRGSRGRDIDMKDV